MDRREFLTLYSGATVSLIGSPILMEDKPYDLLIKNGLVIDPSQKIHDSLDIAIKSGKVIKLAPAIASNEAREVMDVEGRIVTPGFIDIHVHVFPEATSLGIPADPNLIAKGVTTAVDAGSAGYYTWPGFRKWVIEASATRLYATLNISSQGMMAQEVGELADLRFVQPKLALQRIESNRDVILGVKIRLSRDITGDHDLQALKLAREAADAAQLPMMVHINNSYSPIRDILALMRNGDIMTHCYHGNENGILDSMGKILPEVRQAFNKGIHFDVGHGAGSFSFDVAEKALAQEFYPGTISSDLHRFNVEGTVFDQATTLSKFLHLGLSLDKVIELTTIRPVMLFKFNEQIGTLKPGAEADMTIVDLKEGTFTFTDSKKSDRIGHQKLVPWKTIKGGRLYKEIQK